MIRNLRSWILLLFVIAFFHASSQVTVQSGTSLTIQPGTSLSLGNNTVIEYGGILQNFGTFNFKGNFNNDGSLGYTTTSRFVAEGNALQNISSTNALILPYFKVNNAAGVALNSALTITDSLVMQNGILYSSAANPVHFTTTASNPAETNNSYIIGQAVMDDRTIGTNALATFLGVTLTAGSDAGKVNIIRNTGDDEIKTIDGKTSIAANWTINATNANQSGRNISFSWLSKLDNAKYTPAMVLYAGASNYTKLSTLSTDVSATDPRQFTYNNAGQLNRNFTLLDTGFQMKFIRFTGSSKPAGVQLNWITGTEFNNKGFDVERSLDGVNFTKVNFVDAKNGVTTNSYDYLDAGVAGLKTKLVYYRLKQIDKNGFQQYSNTIVLMLNGLFYFNVYPNPFVDHLAVDVVKADEDPLQVRIITANGAEVFNKKYTIQTSGRIELKGLNYLPAGIYFLNIANQHFYETIKVIKYHN